MDSIQVILERQPTDEVPRQSINRNEEEIPGLPLIHSPQLTRDEAWRAVFRISIPRGASASSGGRHIRQHAAPRKRPVVATTTTPVLPAASGLACRHGGLWPTWRFDLNSGLLPTHANGGASWHANTGVVWNGRCTDAI